MKQMEFDFSDVKALGEALQITNDAPGFPGVLYGPENGIPAKDVAAMSPTKGDMKEGLRGGKPQLSHIPAGALIWAARVFQYGAHKYERGNFLRPQVDELADFDRLSAYLDAMLRHTVAVTSQMEYARGTTELERKDILLSAGWRDHESGLPHLAHALTGLMMAIQQGINAGILPADPGCPWEAK